MAIFLFEVLALMFFWKLADISRFKELVPIILTGVFIRFLQHYIIVEWFQFWDFPGAKWKMIWIPISADLTFWPVVSYLFIQYLPKERHLLYVSIWTIGMLVYLQVLMWLDVFSFRKGWNLGFAGIMMFLWFGAIYLVARWLSQQPSPRSTQKGALNKRSRLS